MDAMMAEVIGTAAGTLTTLAFLPQVIKTWRSQSTHDISLLMFLGLCLGLLLWLIYGILKDAWPVIIANLVTLLLASLILAMKLRGMLRDRRNRKKQRE